ncbi:MAG: sulfatase-like hydrolase/transferase [Gemmiger sp.]|nr:sulfatase-like hydrolase/transferase [Gemmiger sp.]
MPKQVILLMTDTTRTDMLGCYGNPAMQTPNLDHLAATGLRYQNAYTCQPVCGPARSAVFTGLFPHSNGMVTNSVAMGDTVKTIGQRLQDGGIPCGYIGKWHLDGSDYFGNGRCPAGFDPTYWYDMRCYLNELSDADKRRSRQSETSFDADMSAEFTYAHRCANRALSFLETHAGRDFFLTVSLDEPHGPSLCPAPFNTMYRGVAMPQSANYADDLRQKPQMQRLWAGQNLAAPPESLNAPTGRLALFLGCNSFADSELGRVLAAAETLAPDALVIYTSDHGDMLGNHRLRGKNAAMYREVANIPLLIRHGRASRRGVVEAPASHIDITPTVLDFFGLPQPACLEGNSMLGQIKGESPPPNRYVYTEFTRYEADHDGFGGLQMMRAITDGRYKLAIYLCDTDEFYDTRQDPAELENRIADPALQAERNRLHDALLAHMNATRDPYRGYQWAARPWRPERQPVWENDGYTRQRESDGYEPRQLDYDTGLPMEQAVRSKCLHTK